MGAPAEQIPESVDVAVIGGGSSGIAAACHLARAGRRVAIVEHRAEGLGGAGVHEVDLPLQLYAQTARTLWAIRHAAEAAVQVGDQPAIDFNGLVRRRKQAVAQRIHEINGQLAELGVAIVPGRGYLSSASQVVVLDPETGNDLGVVNAGAVVLAVGCARAGSDTSGERTDGAVDLFNLRRLPKRLLVRGGGWQALGIAALFAQLGSAVTVSAQGAEGLRGLDLDAAVKVAERLRKLGVAWLDEVATVPDGDAFDQIVDATEPAPATDQLGVRKLGINLRTDGRLDTAADGLTLLDGVYGIGSCVDDGYQPRHGDLVAARLAAVVNGARVLPHAPQAMTRFAGTPVAAMGMTEAECARLEMAFRAAWVSVEGKGAGDEETALKLIADAATGELLGAQAVGGHAEALVGAVALAMQLEFSASDLAAVTPVDPVVTEALSAAAAALEAGAT